MEGSFGPKLLSNLTFLILEHPIIESLARTLSKENVVAHSVCANNNEPWNLMSLLLGYKVQKKLIFFFAFTDTLSFFKKHK